MKKLLPVLFGVILLLTLVLTGCGSKATVTTTATATVTAPASIAQSDLDAVKAQLDQAQKDKAKADTDLKAALAKVDELQKQITDLKAQSDFTGLTKRQIAERIIKTYYATHEYIVDVHDCNNMSDDIWDMLKKQGISSRIVIGDVDQSINDILQSNHAWVLADIGDGEYLALETTNGQAVTRDENPRYYTGWYFKDPADVKANDDLRTEYNARVMVLNAVAAQLDSQTIAAQDAILKQLKAKMDTIATRF